MHHLVEYNLIAGAALLILSVVASKASGRLGVPSLLVFIGVGMLAGSEGIGKIYFDNAFFAQTVGVIALAYIFFAGGLSTDLKSVRPAALQATLLGTVGVIITCALTGYFAMHVLNFSLLEGMLLGAIVSSTDAAAVFSVLGAKSVNLKGKIKPLLELESGANDPMAVLLTVGILQLLTNQVSSPLGLVPNFFQQMILGAVIGLAAGKGIGILFNRLKLESEGLYPVLSIALVIFVFSLTQIMGGSGFLSVYIAGLILGDQNFIRKKSMVLFHDGIAWLMQIAMFLTLGLLVFPSRLLPISGKGLLISAFLIFVARPVAVFASLIGAHYTTREKAMISWVGLRGSVPIILATYPLLARVDKADAIFNLVFFIVLTSVLIQGTSIPLVAKWLKVDAPKKQKFRYPIEYVPTGDLKSDLVEIEVSSNSVAVGKSIIELNLPKDSLVVLIQRQGNVIVPKGGTHLEAEDTLLVLAEKEILAEIRKIIHPG